MNISLIELLIGKTIKSIEVDDETLTIKFESGHSLMIVPSGNWDGCGDYDGASQLLTLRDGNDNFLADDELK